MSCSVCGSSRSLLTLYLYLQVKVTGGKEKVVSVTRLSGAFGHGHESFVVLFCQLLYSVGHLFSVLSEALCSLPSRVLFRRVFVVYCHGCSVLSCCVM